MRDFRRDWMRWSPTERIAAAGIASLILCFVPLMAFLAQHGP
jgi:hypothetical protein